jgi:carboxypeptidase T
MEYKNIPLTADEIKNDDIYYSYNELCVLLENIEYENPEIFMYVSIGKTYEGRDIWLVKISDNVTCNENETETLYMGGVHGDERTGYQAVIYSMQAIVENYTNPNINVSIAKNIQNIVNNSELYFIPMVNPDGIEAGVRKNRKPNDCILGNSLLKGVDINRNFPFKWNYWDTNFFQFIFDRCAEISFPCSIPNKKYPIGDLLSPREGQYRGPYPLSENESRAIQSFVMEHNIIISVDYHCAGEKILYPWSYTYNSTPDDYIFKSIAENMSDINHFDYKQGGHWYYVNGAMKDWLYANCSIFPFTIELCKKFQEDGTEDSEELLQICKTHLEVNLFLAKRAMEMDFS